MSTAITSATISREWTRFAPDAIWSAQALPNATTLDSSEFMVGLDQGSVGIQIEADTTVAIAAGQELLIELFSGSVSGTYDTTQAMFKASAAGHTFEIDDEIVGFIPEDVGPYCKIRITTDADESGDDINAYLRYISR